MAENNELIRILVVIIAIVLLLPVLMMVFSWPLMGMWGGGHMWDGGMWSGAGASWMILLMMVVPLAILLGVGYLLYQALNRSKSEKSDPALEELRIAYARGELSDDEFEQRRERLRRETET